MGTRETITELYRCYEAREFNNVLAALPANFRFEWPFDPATAAYSGTYHTKADLMQQLDVLDKKFVFHSYHATNIVVDGDHASAQLEVDLTSKKTGRRFPARIAHFWRFENGVPVHLVEYMDTALMAAET